MLMFGILSVASTMPTIHQFNTWKQTYGKVNIQLYTNFLTVGKSETRNSTVKLRNSTNLTGTYLQSVLFQVYEPKEELKRMKIFMDNLKYIEEFNARKDRTMTLGLNAFSDLVRSAPSRF